LLLDVLLLPQFLDIKHDLPKICEAIKDREKPLDEGFKIIINQFAGVDN
jgi:nuclear protein localization protein 4 homolog